MEIKGIIFGFGQTLKNHTKRTDRESNYAKYFGSVFDFIKSKLGLNIRFTESARDNFVNSMLGQFNDFHNRKNSNSNVFSEFDMSKEAESVIMQNITNLEETSIPELQQTIADKMGRKSQKTLDYQLSSYELWPDVLPVLQELKSKGYLIAIASNSIQPEKHERLIEELGLGEFISCVAISGRIGKRKPDPTIVEDIAKQLGISKDQMVIVGDMLDRDIMCGNLARIRSVWLNIDSKSRAQNIKAIKSRCLPTETIVGLSQLPETLDYMQFTPSPNQIKVGYYIHKPKKKFEIASKKMFISNAEIHYKNIDLWAPVELQGQFDLIVHKATDLMFPKDKQDERAFENLKQYLESHPQTLMIDPFESLYLTKNREAFIQSFKKFKLKKFNIKVRTPKVYTPENTEFPCFIKAVEASEIKGAHSMGIVLTPEGLQQAQKYFSNQVIIQEYVPHKSGVYKVYCVGRKSKYCVRPSCCLDRVQKDFVLFESSVPWAEELLLEPQEGVIDLQILENISAAITEATGLSIFGYDIVVSERSGDYVVIDLNYFPKLKPFENLAQEMNQHILDKVTSNNVIIH